MKPTSFDELPNAIRGRTGEEIVAEQLRLRNKGVIPSYDYCGKDRNKAPRLQFTWGWLVVPDLDVCGGGERFWCEVKTKAERSFHRLSGDYVHGIDKHHYKQYLEVERESGCRVLLFIVEEDTGLILYGPLGTLPIHHETDKMGKGGMVYWDVEEFKELKKL